MLNHSRHRQLSRFHLLGRRFDRKPASGKNSWYEQHERIDSLHFWCIHCIHLTSGENVSDRKLDVKLPGLNRPTKGGVSQVRQLRGLLGTSGH